MPTPAMETMAHAARQALTSATARAMASAVVCMLAAAGCNGPGRAPGEDQRPADDLTDEELIERCATASPDEEGLGCPDGCVTVDLYEGTHTVHVCGGTSAEYIQVCAPTRGTSLERGTEVLDPGHPGRVAFTHGCMDSSPTWLPVGWDRCAGDGGDPEQCQCSVAEDGELLSEKAFWGLVECAGVTEVCGVGGTASGVPEENVICMLEAFRDRVPGVYPVQGPDQEMFLLIPEGSSEDVYRWQYYGPPSLGVADVPSYGGPTDACDPAEHHISFVVERCTLNPPEEYEACLETPWTYGCGFVLNGWPCEPVLDPYAECAALSGARGDAAEDGDRWRTMRPR